jgi:hypothetical protein
MFQQLIVMSGGGAIADEVWTGKWIPRSLKHATTLYRSNDRLVFSVTVVTALLGNGFPGRI